MSKKLLDREKMYMEFVENCSNNAFPGKLSNVLYFEKSLFLRICAGQEILKNLFFKGHKEKLLEISYYGPKFFFLEIVVIQLNIPLFLARILSKIKFSVTLFRMFFHRTKKDPISDLPANENLTFLMSDLDRFTERFEDVIKDSKYICNIYSDCKVKLIRNGNHNYFYLPRLTISQFFLILRAPFWKMTFLIRTYRQYNFIKKYRINKVYIMDGDSPWGVSSAYAAYLANTVSTCVQWGAMAMGVKPGYKIFPFNYYLCTGQYYVDLLSPFSDRTEFLIRPYINKINFDKKQNTNRCNSILFVLNESETAISKKESDFLINLCVETKKRYAHLNVSARPHPRMVLNENCISLFNECGVVLDKTINPNVALIKNKFIVGHISSLMIESLEYDCFPIFMEIGIEKLYPDLIALSAAMKFKTKKEWFLLLDDLLKNYCDYEVEKKLKNSLVKNIHCYEN